VLLPPTAAICPVVGSCSMLLCRRCFREETFGPLVPLFRCVCVLTVGVAGFVCRFCVQAVCALCDRGQPVATHVQLAGRMCTCLPYTSLNPHTSTQNLYAPCSQPPTRFGADEEAVMLANDTEYGLAAYFYTRDLRRAWHIAEQLEYGMVGGYLWAYGGRGMCLVTSVYLRATGDGGAVCADSLLNPKPFSLTLTHTNRSGSMMWPSQVRSLPLVA
jgi:hypothetical protein